VGAKQLKRGDVITHEGKSMLEGERLAGRVDEVLPDGQVNVTLITADSRLIPAFNQGPETIIEMR